MSEVRTSLRKIRELTGNDFHNVRNYYSQDAMSVETKVSIEAVGESLPPHLMENFQKAEQKIRETYGKSPPASDLARLWLASATSWAIQAEFERTILSIKHGMAQPNKEGIFDEDSFDF